MLLYSRPNRPSLLRARLRERRRRHRDARRASPAAADALRELYRCDALPRQEQAAMRHGGQVVARRMLIAFRGYFAALRRRRLVAAASRATSGFYGAPSMRGEDAPRAAAARLRAKRLACAGSRAYWFTPARRARRFAISARLARAREMRRYFRRRPRMRRRHFAAYAAYRQANCTMRRRDARCCATPRALPPPVATPVSAFCFALSPRFGLRCLACLSCRVDGANLSLSAQRSIAHGIFLR